jgi:hypothetical protein
MPDYRKRAQVVLANASLALASGSGVAPTPRTIEELADSYLASIRTEVKGRTFEGYEACLRTYIVPTLGAKKVTRLATDDIRGFKRHLPGRRVAGGRLVAVSTAKGP